MIVTRPMAIRLAILLLATVIVQVSFFSQLSILGAAPNLVSVVIVSLGLLGGGIVRVEDAPAGQHPGEDHAVLHLRLRVVRHDDDRVVAQELVGAAARVHDALERAVGGGD